MRAEAVVVGAGVAGLCAAVRLLEGGFAVRLVARERAADSVSALAGALWFPYRVGPPERVGRWGAASYAALEGLARDPATGARMVDVTLLAGATPDGDPWWAASLPAGAVRPLLAAETPPGYGGGHVARVPFVDTPVHLRWLEARVAALGGRFEARALASLDDAARGAGVVVHCAGLGARDLAHDPALVPVRGDVLLVRTPPGARLRHVVDEDGPNALAYVLPRGRTTVLGGTAVEGDFDTGVREEVVAGILARTARIEPRVKGAEVLRRAVGLRPARPQVRVEAGRLPGGATVIHDYGHGGGGFTLAWGCAEEVVRLARAAVPGPGV